MGGNPNTGNCSDLNSAAAGSSNVNGSTPSDPVSSNSNTSAKLHAVGFAYQASYTDTSGDYNNTTGACYPMTVNNTNLSTLSLHDALPIYSTVTTEPLASQVYDRATVTGIQSSG